MIQNEVPKTFPRIMTERLILREITHYDTKAIIQRASSSVQGTPLHLLFQRPALF
jgi:hypothetical protein